MRTMKIKSPVTQSSSDTPLASPLASPLINKMESSPFVILSIEQIPSTNDFALRCKIIKTIHKTEDTETVLTKNLQNTGYSIAKIYNCYDKDTKKIKKKINKYWKQFQIIKYSGLNEFFGIYLDSQTNKLIIHQQAYQQTLLSFIHTKGIIQNEYRVKIIIKGILKNLTRLHEYGYVHCHIKPNNIMERKLEHLYKTEYINDGWLLIDFDSMVKNQTKTNFKGSIGWQAPEINYDSKKNIYKYSSDTFAIGLIILYIMFGKQPLDIPASKKNKYVIYKHDNGKEIYRKQKKK
eukprot:91966_1